LINTCDDLGSGVVRKDATHASDNADRFVNRVSAVKEYVGVPTYEVRSVDLRRRDADGSTRIVEAKLTLDLQFLTTLASPSHCRDHDIDRITDQRGDCVIARAVGIRVRDDGRGKCHPWLAGDWRL